MERWLQEKLNNIRMTKDEYEVFKNEWNIARKLLKLRAGARGLDLSEIEISCKNA